MRRSILIAPILALAFVAAGCGDPKADASSEEAFKKSITEMEKSLDAAKKDKLEQAVAEVMMSKVLFTRGDEAAMKKAMKDAFDGKTADEIIAEGEAAKASSAADIKKMMEGK